MMSARRLSLAPLTTPDLGPAAFLRCAADAGYGEVALRLIGGDPVRPPADMPPLVRSAAEHAEIRAILDGEGLKVREIEVLLLGPDTDVAASRPMLETGAGFGATELVLGIGDPDHGRAADRLAEAAALAAEHGLTVNLEFVPYSEARDLAAAEAIIERSGVDNVAILVDTFHLARSGGMVEAVAALPPRRIRYLQLCDGPAEAPDGLDALIRQSREHRLDPGTGAFPIAALLAALPSDLPISVEVPNVARIAAIGAVAHARAVREATERLLATAP